MPSLQLAQDRTEPAYVGMSAAEKKKAKAKVYTPILYTLYPIPFTSSTRSIHRSHYTVLYPLLSNVNISILQALLMRWGIVRQLLSS
jgi:hypothetical protein